MTWAMLLPLITQYGIPYAYKIWQIITTHPEPDQGAWDALLALSQKPLLDYINEARAKLGLAPLTSYDPNVNPFAPSQP
jgi:hypothetical protein